MSETELRKNALKNIPIGELFCKKRKSIPDRVAVFLYRYSDDVLFLLDPITADVSVWSIDNDADEIIEYISINSYDRDDIPDSNFLKEEDISIIDDDRLIKKELYISPNADHDDLPRIVGKGLIRENYNTEITLMYGKAFVGKVKKFSWSGNDIYLFFNDKDKEITYYVNNSNVLKEDPDELWNIVLDYYLWD